MLHYDEGSHGFGAGQVSVVFKQFKGELVLEHSSGVQSMMAEAVGLSGACSS